MLHSLILTVAAVAVVGTTLTSTADARQSLGQVAAGIRQRQAEHRTQWIKNIENRRNGLKNGLTNPCPGYGAYWLGPNGQCNTWLQ